MVNLSSASNTVLAAVGGAAVGYLFGSNANNSGSQNIDINENNKFIADMCLSAYSETIDQRKCVDNGMFYWQTTHDAELTKKEIKKYIDDRERFTWNLLWGMGLFAVFLFLYIVVIRRSFF